MWFVLPGDNQHHLVVVVMVTTPISHIECESATITLPTGVSKFNELAALREVPGTRTSSLLVKFFHFHAVLGENVAK